MNFNNDKNIDNDFNQIVAYIIRKKRIKKGYSLEELAEKMQNVVTRQSLYRYEHNEVRMKNIIFQKICIALDENPADVWNEINVKFADYNKQKNSNHVVENIKYLRKKNKLSQVELANKAGVTQATINRWENGLVAPTIDNLFDICNYFNINIGDLICEDLSIEYNEHHKESYKLDSNSGVQIIIDKNVLLTAESIVEINKILMDIMNKQKITSK